MNVPQETAEQMQTAVFAGRKIEAIKLYREATGNGLKDSKEFVEALEAELRQRSPERFTAPAGGGCGTSAAVLALMIVLASFFA